MSSSRRSRVELTKMKSPASRISSSISVLSSARAVLSRSLERLLNRGVLQGIQLEAAKRGVQREQQRAAALAELSVSRRAPVAGSTGLGHAAASRSARFTALRTTSSLSSLAR